MNKAKLPAFNEKVLSISNAPGNAAQVQVDTVKNQECFLSLSGLYIIGRGNVMNLSGLTFFFNLHKS